MAVPIQGAQTQANAANTYLPDWLRGLLGIGQTDFQQTSVPLPSNLAQQSYGRYQGTSVPQISAAVAPTTANDVVQASFDNLAGMPNPAAVITKSPRPGWLVTAFDNSVTEDALAGLEAALGPRYKSWIDAFAARPDKVRSVTAALRDPDWAGDIGPEVDPATLIYEATHDASGKWIGTPHKGLNYQGVTTEDPSMSTANGWISGHLRGQPNIVIGGPSPENTAVHEAAHWMNPMVPPELEPDIQKLQSIYKTYGVPGHMAGNFLDSTSETLADLAAKSFQGHDIRPANPPGWFQQAVDWFWPGIPRYKDFEPTVKKLLDTFPPVLPK